MSRTREPIALFQLADLPCEPLAAWSKSCHEALSRGGSLCSLFGRPDDAGRIVVTALFLDEQGQLLALRGQGSPREAYPSLTERFPAAQMAERELWEQTGLVPAGHPWLKPVRYEGERQNGMDNHAFFSVRGRDIHEVGVGPIHASVIEPGHFRFMCHGEKVHHLEIQLGYQHRGVEALLLKRPWRSLSPLFETIAGDSSIAYLWGHCGAIETLSAGTPDLKSDRIRGIALEMERIAMHLVALTGLATDIAFLQGGATYGRLRTAIINATMRVCGSRFGRGWLRPGATRFGFDASLREDWISTLEAFLADFDEVSELMLASRSVRSRFMGVGVVTTTAARDIGLVGLSARASGLPADWRQTHPGGLHTLHPIPLCVETSGDCWARFSLRIREIGVSARWILDLLRNPAIELDIGGGATLPQVPGQPPALMPSSLVVSVRESFRGPVLQAIETDRDGKIAHYKIQDPSFWNWFGLAMSLRDNDISDFPICNKSFDLSYCGSDL